MLYAVDGVDCKAQFFPFQRSTTALQDSDVGQPSSDPFEYS